MINQIYQLTKPKFINVKYQEEAIDQENHILIRPNYMAVCHADQRYYQGKRDPKILNKKLPMAMIQSHVEPLFLIQQAPTKLVKKLS